MRTNKKSLDWKRMSVLEIVFWSGALIISLVNILLILRGNNFLLYNFYICGISVIAIVIFTIVLIRKSKGKNK